MNGFSSRVLSGLVAAVSLLSAPGFARATESTSPIVPVQTVAKPAPPVLSDVRVIPPPQVLYVQVTTDELQGSWHRAYLESGRIAELLGLGAPEIDLALETLTFSLQDGRQVHMATGIKAAFVDGKVVEFDAAPMVFTNKCGDKTFMIPARLLAEIAGFGVAQSSDGSVVLYR